MTVKLGGLDIIREVIRQHYDLGDVGVPEQLAAAHQRRHRKMTVMTSKGKFLVKTYKRDPVVLDSLRFQHRLSNHLLASGVPVARIQSTRTGVGVVELDTWAMELQGFVEAGPLVLNGVTLKASAQALGKFHHVCRDVHCPPRDAVKWRFSEVPRDLFKRLYDIAAQQAPSKQLEHYCNEIGAFLQDSSQALSEAKRSEFETGLIHGDWHGGNLLFNGDELRAVVDLEFAGDGCYLEDIAYGISNLCVRTSREADRLALRVNILLDNYQKFRRLSWDEEVAVYYAVGVKHVATVSYQSLQAGGQIAGYTAAQWVERLAFQCRWLAELSRRIRFGG
jgi:Ser/Thr protein kinase RdoA (MazF antagonist)